MKKGLLKRVESIVLIVTLLCTVFSSLALADEPDMQEVLVSFNAGENGCYRYNEETGEFDFVPPPEFIEEEAVPVLAIGSTLIQDEDISPCTIIGDDNREPVYNPTSQYASTCLIISNFSGTKRGGTGWLINDTYVMTAGHVLYDLKYGLGFASSVEVYVGASGGKYSDYRVGRCEVVGGEFIGTTIEEYYTKGVFDDWGIIKLDEPVTVNQDYLGRYPVNKLSDMKNRTYYTQGYPEDKNGNVSRQNRVMYTTSGSILFDRKRSLPVVLTNIDNWGGQSGSPIYSFRDGYGYCAEGILVANHEDGGEGVNGLYNSVILYNNYLHNYVYDLING